MAILPRYPADEDDDDDLAGGDPTVDHPTPGTGAGPSANALFGDALELPVEARAAFVRAQCGPGDDAVRRDVEALLAAHDAAGPFLASPTRAHGAAAPAGGDAADPAVGGRIGRYKLVEAIGEGGFGTV